MVNYQEGKIYKIVSYQTDKIYIGSTCKTLLCQRFAGHKNNYKKWLKNNPKCHKITSFELLQYNDAQIILLENFPCENKNELHAREYQLIQDNLNIVVNHHKNQYINKKLYNQLPSVKEYNKQYYKQYSKTDKYKQFVKKYNHVDIICEICCTKGRRHDFARHSKTKYHQKYLQLNNSIQQTTTEYNKLIALIK